MEILRVAIMLTIKSLQLCKSDFTGAFNSTSSQEESTYKKDKAGEFFIFLTINKSHEKTKSNRECFLLTT